MERRRLAGMKPASPSLITENSKSSKSFSKMRKTLKASNLRIVFLKIFSKKEDFGR